MNGMERMPLPHEEPDDTEKNEDPTQPAEDQHKENEEIGRRDFLRRSATVGAAMVVGNLAAEGKSEAAEDPFSFTGPELLHTADSLGNLADRVLREYEDKHNIDPAAAVKPNFSRYLEDYREQQSQTARNIIDEKQPLAIRAWFMRRAARDEKRFEHYVIIGQELLNEPDPKINDIRWRWRTLKRAEMEQRIQEEALRRSAAPQKAFEDIERTVLAEVFKGSGNFSNLEDRIYKALKEESKTARVEERAKSITQELKNKYGFPANEAKAQRIVYGELQRRGAEWGALFAKLKDKK